MTTTADTFALAVQYHQSGYMSEAEQLYRQVVAAEPTHAQAHCNLAVIAAQQGRFAEALASYDAALTLQPDFAEAHFNRGNCLSRMGQISPAIDSFAAAIRCKPDFAAAYLNQGRALVQLGRAAEAVPLFRENVRLLPGEGDAIAHLANALVASGQTEEGVALLRDLIREQTDSVDGHYFLACALSARADKIDEVAKLLLRVIELRPNFVEAHNNLGIVLETQGKLDEAIYHWQQALYYRPGFFAAHNNLGNAYTLQGSIDESLAHFRKAIELQPGHAHVHSNLLLTLNYHAALDPAAVLLEHQRWSQMYTTGITPLPPAAVDRAPDRVLRIGYVSADFRAHTVAAFIEPVLTAHDRTRFHVTCYANVTHPDEATERFRALADEWRPIAALSDDDTAALIRRDAIDILVDLSGHTAGNRLLVFARQPAPVQVTLFGYPTTTAVPGIGYRITDMHADPPGMTEAFCTERLVRLANVAWCYRPPEGTEVTPLPADTAGYVTFASFNNLAKTTDEALAPWAQILHAIPEARLQLLSGMGAPGTRRVNATLAKHGISAQRVTWMTRRPKDEYFRLYHDVDIALDPFPYNGGVTTCDALWMGVPVVALAGKSYVSRQGVSLLTNVKLTELIGATQEEYVQAAVALAHDLPRLRGLRGDLRERMRQSVLTDATRYTRQLEGAYRAIWQRYVSGVA